MNQPTQLPLLDMGHRNHYLFSDHYLKALLPKEPLWAEGLAEAQAFAEWLAEQYAQEGPYLEQYNERQLEEHWFQPILEQLGHVPEPQPAVPGLGQGITRPDFILFPDEASRHAARADQNRQSYAANALAVVEVKKWDVPLGKKAPGGGAHFDRQNPMFQIDTYLNTTGREWGILSNGRQWRLLHSSSSRRLTVFYAVDLLDLLQRNDPEQWLYFTLFFRQAAFRPDTHGHIFLQDALNASHRYARELEEDLQENAYSALQHLIQGFLDLPANRLGADDLPEIYENSLYLLYRLLFILYAESRGLLPLDNDEYRDQFSLQVIQQDIEQGRAPNLRSTRRFWKRLESLFQIINGDDETMNRDLGVPRYNGGLFDPDEHPFLRDKAVGDAALVQAIDLLSRRVAGVSPQGDFESVDYRTLGVRQLGSIYEGLLEYHPRLVNGRVELVTDKGERKATGSYYTPEYIVQYIVENTLGPLVEEATERVRQRGKAATSEARKEAEGQKLVNEILRLKVLDPAMGSGHFLVSATDYLAVALATDPYVQTEHTPEEDVVYWRRRVVERCIYGVDKNPLAVELAKLSLWLATVAKDRPLSFLDHHLKCGDALVGANPHDVGFEPPVILSKRSQQQLAQRKAGQMSLFQLRLSAQLPAVMGKVLEITGRESDSYEAVQSKEAADEAVRQLKEPFEFVADLWTSAYFGNDFTREEYGEALEAVLQPDKLLAQPAVQRAQQIATQRRFFHWELAFPEVFYDVHGQSLGEPAGFDAVIGNPPYVSSRNEGFLREAGAFISARYETAFYQVDLYYLFVELASSVVRQDCRWSYILPDVWIASVKASSFREWIVKNSSLITFGFPEEKVFSADVDTVVILCKTRQKQQLSSGAEVYDLEPSEVKHRITLNLKPDGQEFLLTVHSQTLNDIMIAGVPLDSISLTGRGIGAYHHSKHSQEIITTRAFHANHKKDETFRPELGGENVVRYGINWQGDRWISYGEWLSEPRDPALFEGERVLSRKIFGETLSCTFVETDWLVDQQVYVAAQFRNGYHAKYALAVLASRLMGFYARKRFHEEGLFPHLRVAQFRSLPIRRIEFTLSSEERSHLLNKGQKLYEQFCQKDDYDCVLGFVEHHLGQQPEQSDVVHDLLAFLAEQMIALNQVKQQHLTNFWLDLQGWVADSTTFAKLQKGRQERSLAKDTPLQPFVNPTSHSTRTLDESLAWDRPAFIAFLKQLAGTIPNLSKLVEVYQQYTGEYGRLTHQLTHTDTLIDRVVYRLYGLTEEEIAVVRGEGVTR